MRRVLLSVLLLLLLAGCGGAGPSQAPAPVPGIGAQGGGQAPDAPPGDSSQRVSLFDGLMAGDFCNADLPVPRRAEALRTVLTPLLKGWTVDEIVKDWESRAQAEYKKEKQSFPCAAVDATAGSDSFFVRGQFGSDGVPFVFGWQTGDGWQLAAVEPLDGEAGAIEHLSTVIARFPDEKPELYVVGRMGGTGGFASLLYGTLTPEGQLSLMPMITPHQKAHFESPGENLILLTYRGAEGGPLAWSCNACMPVADQLLVEVEGSMLSELGRRTYSYPLDAVNYLLGAAAAGNRERALALVADPSLVDQIAGLIPDPLEWTPTWEDPEGIQMAEMHNWHLLPPAARTTLTEAQRQATVLLRGPDGKTLMLRLTRYPDREWRVDSLSS